MNELESIYFDDFEKIRQIIEQARQEATYKVNETIINLYWDIGQFVSQKTLRDGWGRSTVKQLSEYILSKEPGIRGYSAQNIWRMKQFFETYQNKPELNALLRANTWSNNLHIMSKTKTELQCLVAIDLKIDDFKPEYLGKMEFYLEALDRDIKKPHENPSVGIILCKSRDEDVVEYALSRNMSSTMISEYRTKLISKEILQKKLEELYEAADESQNSQQC